MWIPILTILSFIIVVAFFVKFFQGRAAIQQENNPMTTLKATVIEVNYNFLNFSKYNDDPYIVVEYKTPDDEIKTERFMNRELLEYKVGEQIEIYYNQDNECVFKKHDPNKKRHDLLKDKRFIILAILAVLALVAQLVIR